MHMQDMRSRSSQEPLGLATRPVPGSPLRRTRAPHSAATSTRGFAHAALALALGALAACHDSPPIGNATSVQERPLVLVRFLGGGPMPALEAPATYELCMDMGSGRLSAWPEHAPPGTEDRIANVLMTWRWRALSSRPINRGTLCWLQRFEPEADAAGRTGVRSTPVLPRRWLRLGAGGGFEEVAGGDGEDRVPFLRTLDQGGARFVLLAPEVEPRVPSEPPRPALDQPTMQVKKDKIAGSMPRLPDEIRTANIGSTLLAAYRICVDTQGRPERLTPIVPIPGAHQALHDALRTWRFRPQPIPLCFLDVFQFVIDGPRFVER